MAWQFGDGFDLYAAGGDAANGYWDLVSGTLPTFVAGRFSGSQALQYPSAASFFYAKSGNNDAVHHIVVAFRQTSAITGSTNLTYFAPSDGGTSQCSIIFRSDGAILLTTGGTGGTVIATYTGAFPVANTWYAFEIEILISSTAGYMNVRRNGNTSNDFTSATNLNTRGGTANNYANRLYIGSLNVGASGHQIDDLYWRSDASSVPWMGDLRCYTRMPASDQSVQFSRSPASPVLQSIGPNTTTGSYSAGQATYTPFVAAYSGTIGSATLNLNAGITGHLKAAIYDNTGTSGNPGTAIATSNALTNPPSGANAITFPSPATVVKGQSYWIAADADVAIVYNVTAATTAIYNTVAYASFPAGNPTGFTTLAHPLFCSFSITTSLNAEYVNEAQQDATTSYVYDSTVNDADFYGIAAIASTPVATIAVTTRGYMQKSDAGTRTAAVQLKSGASTVASTTLVLTTSGWQWAWRTDTLDPNTSAAWTAAAVNNAQVGPKVIA